MLTLSSAFLALVIGAGPAGSVRPIRPGDRIRVHARDETTSRQAADAGVPKAVPTEATSRFTGTVVDVANGHLVLDVPERSEQVDLRWDEIASIERSLGQRRSRGAGALKGLGIGLAVGALIGLKSSAACAESSINCGVLGALVFAPPGALVGALAAPKAERWQGIPIPLARRPAGPSVGLVLRF